MKALMIIGVLAGEVVAVAFVESLVTPWDGGFLKWIIVVAAPLVCIVVDGWFLRRWIVYGK